MLKNTKQNIKVNSPPRHELSDSFELMCNIEKSACFQSGTQKTLDLEAIKNAYSSLITSDPILKSDFNDLLNCIQGSTSDTAQDCNTIMMHMIDEIAESASDHQRLADDGAACEAGYSAPNIAVLKYQNLKRDLEEYYASQKLT